MLRFRKQSRRHQGDTRLHTARNRPAVVIGCSCVPDYLNIHNSLRCGCSAPQNVSESPLPRRRSRAGHEGAVVQAPARRRQHEPAGGLLRQAHRLRRAARLRPAALRAAARAERERAAAVLAGGLRRRAPAGVARAPGAGRARRGAVARFRPARRGRLVPRRGRQPRRAPARGAAQAGREPGPAVVHGAVGGAGRDDVRRAPGGSRAAPRGPGGGRRRAGRPRRRRRRERRRRGRGDARRDVARRGVVVGVARLRGTGLPRPPGAGGAQGPVCE